MFCNKEDSNSCTWNLTIFQEKKSKAPVRQLVNAKVNSGNRKAVLASNYTLQLRICECHARMKCDVKGTKHYSHCIWLLKYNSSKFKIFQKTNLKIKISMKFDTRVTCANSCLFTQDYAAMSRFINNTHTRRFNSSMTSDHQRKIRE